MSIRVKDLKAGQYVYVDDDRGYYIESVEQPLLVNSLNLPKLDIVWWPYSFGSWDPCSSRSVFDVDFVFSSGVADVTKMPVPSSEMLNTLSSFSCRGKQAVSEQQTQDKKKRINGNEHSEKCVVCGCETKLLLTTRYCPKCE